MHGKWIDHESVFGNDALKENFINLYIFWKLNNYRIQSYLWNFPKSQCRSDIKRNLQNTASFKLVSLLLVNIGKVFSHITLKKGACDFPYVVWFLFCHLLKFDIINADVPFWKRGHNLETGANLSKARHPFSKEVSLNVGADFPLIPSEDAHKRTKNVHPFMQLYFIKKKTKNISWDFYDLRC